MCVWQMAGLCSASVRQATVVNWMKKANTDNCLRCGLGVTENLGHFLREEYLPKFYEINMNISLTFENENQILMHIGPCLLPVTRQSDKGMDLSEQGI
jgi:hypothetical protein